MSSPCTDDSDSILLDVDPATGHLVASLRLDPNPENSAVVTPGEGMFVPGRPPLVSTLPNSPADGDEVYYLTSDTDVVWHLRYYLPDLAWKYVGGLPLRTGLTTTSTRNASSGYGDPDSGPAGPSVVCPLAGLYRVRFSYQANGQNPDCHVTVKVGGAASADANSIRFAATPGITSGNSFQERVLQLAGIVAGTTLLLQYSNDSGSGATFQNRDIEILPKAVN